MLSLVLIASQPVSAQVLYAFDLLTRSVVRVKPSGTAVPLVSVPTAITLAHAIDRLGMRLFLGEGDSGGITAIAIIDLRTGTISRRTLAATVDPMTLVYDPVTDSLFGNSTVNGQISQISLTTGAVTVIAPGSPSAPVAPISLDESGRRLFVSGYRTVNLLTGADTLTTPTLTIHGAKFDPSIAQLVGIGGVTGGGSPPHSYILVDPSTAQAQTLAPTGVFQVIVVGRTADLAFDPVTRQVAFQAIFRTPGSSTEIRLFTYDVRSNVATSVPSFLYPLEYAPSTLAIPAASTVVLALLGLTIAVVALKRLG